MDEMFESCTLIRNINLLNFNIENVIDMRSLFNSCLNLQNIILPISKTNKKISVSLMFAYCMSLVKIKNLNKLEIQESSNKKLMFYYAKKNKEIKRYMNNNSIFNYFEN